MNLGLGCATCLNTFLKRVRFIDRRAACNTVRLQHTQIPGFNRARFNPGDTAIKAALYPNSEYIADNYLYFCLMDPDSGALIFAKRLRNTIATLQRYNPLW